MKEVAEGQTIAVDTCEAFAIVRQGLEGSGYETKVLLPDGITHITTERADRSVFGGMPQVREVLRCNRSGTFTVRLVTGRSWQKQRSEATVTVRCR